MQDNVEIYTKALIRVIHDSKEYRQYEEIKRKVAGFPELKQQIDQYRKEAFLLQNSGDATHIYERTEEFERRNIEFRKNPLVNEYLACELAVCRMLQNSAFMVVKSVDIELDDIAHEIRF